MVNGRRDALSDLLIGRQLVAAGWRLLRKLDGWQVRPTPGVRRDQHHPGHDSGSFDVSGDPGEQFVYDRNHV
jgi:hypothetical protein